MRAISISAILLISVSLFAQNTNELVKQNTNFAFDLYQNLSKSNSGKNLFFSPYSISEAMAITYAGARTTTEKEFQNVLYFSDKQTLLQNDFSILKNQLSINFDSVSLKIANSLWAQKGYNFVPTYIQTVKSNYHAPVIYVNYKKGGTRKRAVGNINSWVEENTNNQIKDLISKQDVTKNTRLIIVNAIWFYGDWLKTFNPKKTKLAIFNSIRAEQKTEFMNRKGLYFLYNDDIISAISIPYKNSKQSMMILLPNKVDGIGLLEKNLDNYYIENILNDMQQVELKLSIPKFTSEYSVNLKKAFMEMGLKEAFTNHADFSGMSTENDLKIDKILHKARIDVSEEGTEAAAATAVIMVRKTAIMKPIEFKADHPFIYLIRDNNTSSILFMGRLSEIEK